jgi:GntR family transcriptional repressor for pyruvate dehydrogenase complex
MTEEYAHQPVNQLFSSINKERTSALLVDQIKQAIFNDKLVIGEKLPPERELAQIFQTSRVTVREALLILMQSGFMERRKGPKGGYFVSELGPGNITNLLSDMMLWGRITVEKLVEARQILEPQIAQLAAVNATDAQLALISESISDLTQYFSERSKFQIQDETFHRRLAEASGNPILVLFQESVMKIVFKFITGVPLDDLDKENILASHKAIFDRVVARDAGGAGRVMMEHMEKMKELLNRIDQDKKKGSIES